jgi:hypothetical protein
MTTAPSGPSLVEGLQAATIVQPTTPTPTLPPATVAASTVVAGGSVLTDTLGQGEGLVDNGIGSSTTSGGTVPSGGTSGGGVAGPPGPPGPFGPPGPPGVVTASLPLLLSGSALSIDLSPYALLASPTFTGDPKAPTPAPGDNDTSLATTAFVQAAVSGGSLADAPSDGSSYGRKNHAWSAVLAVSGDIVDGGNFITRGGNF